MTETTTVHAEPSDFWDGNVIVWCNGQFYRVPAEEFNAHAQTGELKPCWKITSFTPDTKELDIDCS